MSDPVGLELVIVAKGSTLSPINSYPVSYVVGVGFEYV